MIGVSMRDEDDVDLARIDPCGEQAGDQQVGARCSVIEAREGLIARVPQVAGAYVAEHQVALHPDQEQGVRYEQLALRQVVSCCVFRRHVPEYHGGGVIDPAIAERNQLRLADDLPVELSSRWLQWLICCFHGSSHAIGQGSGAASLKPLN